MNAIINIFRELKISSHLITNLTGEVRSYFIDVESEFERVADEEDDHNPHEDCGDCHLAGLKQVNKCHATSVSTNWHSPGH